eukprot:903064_1
MSIIKPEVFTSMGSHSQVRYSVSKSDSTHVFVKSEALTNSQPSVARFRCEYCPQDFSLKQYLVEHALRAHGRLPTPCKPEKFRFALSIVKPENPDLDAYEASTYSVKSSDTNEQRTNINKHTFECDVCHKVLKSRSALKKHMITHSDNRPFTCDKCPKAFKRKFGLNQHLRIHTGERPYRCDTCKRSFTQSKSLNQHLHTFHSEGRPYSCNVCPKTFKTNDNLNKHLRIHSEERPYSCNVCQKTFKGNVNLNQHLRIHSEERPY